MHGKFQIYGFMLDQSITIVSRLNIQLTYLKYWYQIKNTSQQSIRHILSIACLSTVENLFKVPFLPLCQTVIRNFLSGKTHLCLRQQSKQETLIKTIQLSGMASCFIWLISYQGLDITPGNSNFISLVLLVYSKWICKRFIQNYTDMWLSVLFFNIICVKWNVILFDDNVIPLQHGQFSPKYNGHP